MEDVLLDPVELTEAEQQEVAGGCGGCSPNPCNPCGGGLFQNGLVNVNDVNILSGIGILGTGIAV